MGFQHVFYFSSLARPNLLSRLRGLQTVVGNEVSFRGIPLYGKTTSRLVCTQGRSGIGHIYNVVGVQFWEQGVQKTSSRPLSTAVIKDVVLFEHDRTKFFRLLALFCGGQVIFWTYLAHFAFTNLRDVKGNNPDGRKVMSTGLAGVWSFEMNLGSASWRYGFTLACVVIGGAIAGLGALFCRRSVSQVILHKGGRMVTVTTQSPLGPDKGRRINIPLSSVTCHAHRNESPSFIPLRVKDHKFYFLLDKEGTLNNVKLFDVTVGAYRSF